MSENRQVLYRKRKISFSLSHFLDVRISIISQMSSRSKDIFTSDVFFNYVLSVLEKFRV